MVAMIAAGLARRTSAAASWPRFRHPLRTFGARAFRRSRHDVWAERSRDGRRAGGNRGHKQEARRGLRACRLLWGEPRRASAQ